MPNNEGALISEVHLITREYGSYVSSLLVHCKQGESILLL